MVNFSDPFLYHDEYNTGFPCILMKQSFQIVSCWYSIVVEGFLVRVQFLPNRQYISGKALHLWGQIEITCVKITLFEDNSTSVLSCKQRRRWSVTYNCQLHESVCDPRAALRDLSNMVKLTIHVHVLRRLLSTGSIVWCFTLSGLKFQMNFEQRTLTFSAKFGGTLRTNVL